MRVLYTGRNLRLRRREMIAHPPPGVEYVTEYPLSSQPPEHKLSNPKRTLSYRLQRFALHLIWMLRLPNVRNVDIPEGVDVIHTPGQLLRTTTPYVVEVDNPTCLSFYNSALVTSRLARWLVRRHLRREAFRGFVCMSEASRHALSQLFPEYAKRMHVAYPYVADPHGKPRKPRAPRFLFSSTQFSYKGGRQLLEAFGALNGEATLTLLTKRSSLDEQTLERIEKDERITLIEAKLSKEEVWRLFARHDVFVVPTLMDSFGMVFLEAIASGLAVIATDLYALPEMVSTDNGFLVEPPIRYFDKKDLPNPRWWSAARITRYADTHALPEYTAEIKNAMQHYVDDRKLVEKHSRASLKRYKERFSEKRRQEALLEAYTSARRKP